MSDLVSATRELAKRTDRKVSDICKAANVKPRWFYRFVDGDFKDPGANKVQRLYEALKATDLVERRRHERRT